MPGTTLFPAALDDHTTLPGDYAVDGPGHVQAHDNVEAAVRALQAKVGVDNSAVPGSLDARLAALANSGLDLQAVRDLVAGMLVDAQGNPFVYDGVAGRLTIPVNAAGLGGGSTDGGGGGVTTSGGGGTVAPVVYAIHETFASEAANAAIAAFETGGAFDGTLRLQKIGSTPFARDTAAGFATAPTHELATIEALLRYDGPVDPSRVSYVDAAHCVNPGAALGDNHYWFRVLYQGGAFSLQVYQRANGFDYPQFGGAMALTTGDPFRVRVAFTAGTGNSVNIAGSYREDSASAWTPVGAANTALPYGNFRSGFRRVDLSNVADWARGELRVVNA